MSEQGEVHFGSTLIRYTVVRSARRRKTVAITLDASRGVLVAVPAKTPAAEIKSIVAGRAAWIVQRASSRTLEAQAKQYVNGESLPYLGQQACLFVEHAAVRSTSVAFNPWSFHVTVPAHLADAERHTAIHAAVVRWYRTQAHEHLAERTAYWAGRTGLAPASILIREQRRRWASCSASGVIRFNWRLMLAPPSLIDYVVVHELMHLRVPNHSPAFWAEVAAAMPDFTSRRAQLRKIGSQLIL